MDKKGFDYSVPFKPTGTQKPQPISCAEAQNVADALKEKPANVPSSKVAEYAEHCRTCRHCSKSTTTHPK